MERHELWKLSAADFNKWRRENDLKDLFNTFNETLPEFSKWLALYKFTPEFILSTDQPGSFFFWDKETLLIESNGSQSNPFYFIPIVDKKHEKRLTSLKEEENTKKYRFKPYLMWAKEELKKDNILKSRFSELDSFRFVLVNAPDVPEHSHTFIAPGIRVLKLGGTQIN